MRKLTDRELRLIARPKRKDLFRAQSIPFLRPDRKTKFLTCRFQSASYSLTPFAALFPHFSPSLPAVRRREAKGRLRHLSDRRRRKKESPQGDLRALRVWGWVVFYEAKEIAAKRKGRGAEKFPASFFLLSLYLHYTTFFQRKTPDDAKGAFAAARGNFFRRTPPEKTTPAYLFAKKHLPRGVLAM